MAQSMLKRQQEMFEGDGVVTKDFEAAEKILRRKQEAGTKSSCAYARP
jgi:hypothetical protein